MSQKPLRAVIYGRVSTDKQRDNYSVPVQIEKCLEYIDERGYILVGDWYVDPESGRDVRVAVPGAVPAYIDDITSMTIKRPAMNALLDYCGRNDVDRVVIYRLDRLGRDFVITGLFEQQLDQIGVRIDYVEGNYEDDLDGEMHKDLDKLLAKAENSRRRKRVIDGKLKKAQRGKYVAGRPPFGYDLDREAVCGLSINQKEAETVRQIYALYLEKRLSIRGITNYLNTNGVRSAGGGPWGRSTVAKILRNETYAGRHYYNKTETKQHYTKKIQKPRDKADWILIEVPEIVSQTVFNAVQERRAENGNRVRRTPKRGRFYLLRSMVVCVHCGKSYVAQARSTRHHAARPYLVYRHRANEGHCSNHQMRASILEPFVWNKVREAILNPDVLVSGHKRMLETMGDRMTATQEMLAAQEESRAKYEKQKRGLIKLHLAGDITRSEFLETRADYDLRLEKANTLIAELKKEVQSQPVAPDLESFQEFTAEVRAYLITERKVPPSEKRRIFETLGVQVLVDPETGEVEVKGWFNNDADDSSVDGGSNSTSATHYAPPPPPPPWPASHAPAP